MILKRSIINFINKKENDLSEYEKKDTDVQYQS